MKEEARADPSLPPLSVACLDAASTARLAVFLPSRREFAISQNFSIDSTPSAIRLHASSGSENLGSGGRQRRFQPCLVPINNKPCGDRLLAQTNADPIPA